MLTAVILSGLLATSPDPDALLAQADEALRDVSVISFEADRTCVGWLATQSPNVRGRVIAERISQPADDMFAWRLAIDATSTEPVGDSQRVQAAFDGEMAISVLHGDKTTMSGPMDSQLGPTIEGGGRIAAWMVLWDSVIGPRARGEVDYSLIHEGQVMVGDQLCDVVRLGLYELGSVPEYETWVFLGQDHLPRRFDVTYYDDIGDAAVVTLTLSAVNTTSPAPEGAFSLAAPDGYEAVEFVPDEFDIAGDFGMEEPAVMIEVGQPAPDWSLPDADGHAHSLVDHRGMIVVMDFWATWCPPCREAMPAMQRLHERYKGKPVAILGVNCWEEGDPAEFMADNDFTYRLLLEADEVAEAYGVEGIPTLYVISRTGEVLYSHVGFSPDLEDQIAKVIDAELAR